MTSEQVVDNLLLWAVAAVPSLASHTYDHVPAGKEKGLPDVVCELLSEEIVRDDPDFPLVDLQQVVLRIWRLGLSIMVNAGVSEADAGTAQASLRTMAEALVSSVLADHTLGGRVPLASPFVTIDYTPPFVEYQDGTRGRELTLTMAVAQPVADLD